MHFVGNTMIDTLVALEERFRARGAAARGSGSSRARYLLVTLHRPALVDGPLLAEAIAALERVAGRDAGRLPGPPADPQDARRRASRRRSTLIDPVGYLDFLSLEADAAAVLTDSGGIQEETTYLGVPCFTLRDNTERPVTVRAGTNTLLGLARQRIARDPGAARRGRPRAPRKPPEKWDGQAAERVADVARRLVASRAVPLPSLVPRDRVFFDLFNQAGQNTLRAARLLKEMLEDWPDEGGLAREILLAEQEGDRITHDIIQRLNTTFVTPIDGEDIYGLATQLDDIVDYIEETADFMGLYRIEAPMEQSLAMADVLVKSCEQLAAALEHLRGFKDLEQLLDRDPPARERGRPPLPRRGRLAVRERDRPDVRDPLAGHLPAARAGGRRDRDRRPHPRRHRDQERVSAGPAVTRSPDLILGIVVATALAFDFTNGFHDTANVVATSISTRAMSPRIAVGYAAVLNFVGAFISLEVAATVAEDVVDAGAITTTVIFAGLVGAIAWNLITWYFGLPSSSSHALIGGVVGATFAAAGADAVFGEGILGKVLIPAVIAPVLAFVVGGDRDRHLLPDRRPPAARAR